MKIKLLSILILVFTCFVASGQNLSSLDGFQPMPDKIFEQPIPWIDAWHKTQRDIIKNEGFIEILIIIEGFFDDWNSEWNFDLTTYALLNTNPFKNEDKSYILLRIRDVGTTGVVDSVEKIEINDKLREEFINEAWSWVNAATIGGQALNIAAGVNINAYVTAGELLPNNRVAPRQLIQALNPPPNGKLLNLVGKFDKLLDNSDSRSSQGKPQDKE